jgi:hypothetical protein
MGDLFMSDIEHGSKAERPPAHAQRGRAAAPAPVPKRKDPRLVTRGSGCYKSVGKGVKRG